MSQFCETEIKHGGVVRDSLGILREESAVTELLQKAIQETQKLSEQEQDLLAALLLDNINDAKLWDQQFAESRDVLEELFDEAAEDYNGKRTRPINS